ncbi:MAG TPA: 4Fe-4S binding protein [bacterium]|nr:4Fe-4S binding protein [bacterium]
MKKLLSVLFFSALISSCDPTMDSPVIVDDSKCLGYSCRICERVCRFDAIHFYGPESTPVIDPDKCTACGECVKECPQQAITITGKQ